MEIGDKVLAEMPDSSFYKKVIGTVTGIKRGYVEIKATHVMSKWGNTFEQHPTSCATSAKLGSVVVM